MYNIILLNVLFENGEVSNVNVISKGMNISIHTTLKSKAGVEINIIGLIIGIKYLSWIEKNIECLKI